MPTAIRTLASLTLSLALVGLAACGDDTSSSTGTSSTGTSSASGTASTGTSSGTGTSASTSTSTSSSSGSSSTGTASGSSGDTGTASSAGSTGAGSTGAGSTGAGSTGGTGGGIQDCSLMPAACPMGAKCRVSTCCDMGVCVPPDAKTCGGIAGMMCPDGLVCVTESCVADALGFCVGKDRADQIVQSQPGCWNAG